MEKVPDLGTRLARLGGDQPSIACRNDWTQDKGLTLDVQAAPPLDQLKTAQKTTAELPDAMRQRFTDTVAHITGAEDVSVDPGARWWQGSTKGNAPVEDAGITSSGSASNSLSEVSFRVDVTSSPLPRSFAPAPLHQSQYNAARQRARMKPTDVGIASASGGSLCEDRGREAFRILKSRQETDVETAAVVAVSALKTESGFDGVFSSLSARLQEESSRILEERIEKPSPLVLQDVVLPSFETKVVEDTLHTIVISVDRAESEGADQETVRKECKIAVTVNEALPASVLLANDGKLLTRLEAAVTAPIDGRKQMQNTKRRWGEQVRVEGATEFLLATRNFEGETAYRDFFANVKKTLENSLTRDLYGGIEANVDEGRFVMHLKTAATDFDLAAYRVLRASNDWRPIEGVAGGSSVQGIDSNLDLLWTHGRRNGVQLPLPNDAFYREENVLDLMRVVWDMKMAVLEKVVGTRRRGKPNDAQSKRIESTLQKAVQKFYTRDSEWDDGPEDESLLYQAVRSQRNAFPSLRLVARMAADFADRLRRSDHLASGDPRSREREEACAAACLGAIDAIETSMGVSCGPTSAGGCMPTYAPYSKAIGLPLAAGLHLGTRVTQTAGPLRALKEWYETAVDVETTQAEYAKEIVLELARCVEKASGIVDAAMGDGSAGQGCRAERDLPNVEWTGLLLGRANLIASLPERAAEVVRGLWDAETVLRSEDALGMRSLRTEGTSSPWEKHLNTHLGVVRGQEEWTETVSPTGTVDWALERLVGLRLQMSSCLRQFEMAGKDEADADQLIGGAWWTAALVHGIGDVQENRRKLIRGWTTVLQSSVDEVSNAIVDLQTARRLLAVAFEEPPDSVGRVRLLEEAAEAAREARLVCGEVALLCSIDDAVAWGPSPLTERLRYATLLNPCLQIETDPEIDCFLRSATTVPHSQAEEAIVLEGALTTVLVAHSTALSRLKVAKSQIDLNQEPSTRKGACFDPVVAARVVVRALLTHVLVDPFVARRVFVKFEKTATRAARLEGTLQFAVDTFWKTVRDMLEPAASDESEVQTLLTHLLAAADCVDWTRAEELRMIDETLCAERSGAWNARVDAWASTATIVVGDALVQQQTRDAAVLGFEVDELECRSAYGAAVLVVHWVQSKSSYDEDDLAVLSGKCTQPRARFAARLLRQLPLSGDFLQSLQMPSILLRHQAGRETPLTLSTSASPLYDAGSDRVTHQSRVSTGTERLEHELEAAQSSSAHRVYGCFRAWSDYDSLTVDAIRWWDTRSEHAEKKDRQTQMGCSVDLVVREGYFVKEASAVAGKEAKLTLFSTAGEVLKPEESRYQDVLEASDLLWVGRDTSLHCRSPGVLKRWQISQLDAVGYTRWSPPNSPQDGYLVVVEMLSHLRAELVTARTHRDGSTTVALRVARSSSLVGRGRYSADPPQREQNVKEAVDRRSSLVRSVEDAVARMVTHTDADLLTEVATCLQAVESTITMFNVGTGMLADPRRHPGSRAVRAAKADEAVVCLEAWCSARASLANAKSQTHSSSNLTRTIWNLLYGDGVPFHVEREVKGLRSEAVGLGVPLLIPQQAQLNVQRDRWTAVAVAIARTATDLTAFVTLRATMGEGTEVVDPTIVASILVGRVLDLAITWKAVGVEAEVQYDPDPEPRKRLERSMARQLFDPVFVLGAPLTVALLSYYLHEAGRAPLQFPIGANVDTRVLGPSVVGAEVLAHVLLSFSQLLFLRRRDLLRKVEKLDHKHHFETHLNVIIPMAYTVLNSELPVQMMAVTNMSFGSISVDDVNLQRSGRVLMQYRQGLVKSIVLVATTFSLGDGLSAHFAERRRLMREERQQVAVGQNAYFAFLTRAFALFYSTAMLSPWKTNPQQMARLASSLHSLEQLRKVIGNVLPIGWDSSSIFVHEEDVRYQSSGPSSIGDPTTRSFYDDWTLEPQQTYTWTATNLLLFTTTAEDVALLQQVRREQARAQQVGGAVFDPRQVLKTLLVSECSTVILPLLATVFRGSLSTVVANLLPSGIKHRPLLAAAVSGLTSFVSPGAAMVALSRAGLSPEFWSTGTWRLPEGSDDRSDMRMRIKITDAKAQIRGEVFFGLVVMFTVPYASSVVTPMLGDRTILSPVMECLMTTIAHSLRSNAMSSALQIRAGARSTLRVMNGIAQQTFVPDSKDSALGQMERRAVDSTCWRALLGTVLVRSRQGVGREQLQRASLAMAARLALACVVAKVMYDVTEAYSEPGQTVDVLDAASIAGLGLSLAVSGNDPSSTASDDVGYPRAFDYMRFEKIGDSAKECLVSAFLKEQASDASLFGAAHDDASLSLLPSTRGLCNVRLTSTLTSYELARNSPPPHDATLGTAYDSLFNTENQNRDSSESKLSALVVNLHSTSRPTESASVALLKRRATGVSLQALGLPTSVGSSAGKAVDFKVFFDKFVDTTPLSMAENQIDLLRPVMRSIGLDFLVGAHTSGASSQTRLVHVLKSFLMANERNEGLIARKWRYDETMIDKSIYEAVLECLQYQCQMKTTPTVAATAQDFNAIGGALLSSITSIVKEHTAQLTKSSAVDIANGISSAGTLAAGLAVSRIPSRGRPPPAPAPARAPAAAPAAAPASPPPETEASTSPPSSPQPSGSPSPTNSSSNLPEAVNYAQVFAETVEKGRKSLFDFVSSNAQLLPLAHLPYGVRLATEEQSTRNPLDGRALMRRVCDSATLFRYSLSLCDLTYPACAALDVNDVPSGNARKKRIRSDLLLDLVDVPDISNQNTTLQDRLATVASALRLACGLEVLRETMHMSERKADFGSFEFEVGDVTVDLFEEEAMEKCCSLVMKHHVDLTMKMVLRANPSLNAHSRSETLLGRQIYSPALANRPIEDAGSVLRETDVPVVLVARQDAAFVGTTESLARATPSLKRFERSNSVNTTHSSGDASRAKNTSSQQRALRLEETQKDLVAKVLQSTTTRGAKDACVSDDSQSNIRAWTSAPSYAPATVKECAGSEAHNAVASALHAASMAMQLQRQQHLDLSGVNMPGNTLEKINFDVLARLAITKPLDKPSRTTSAYDILGLAAKQMYVASSTMAVQDTASYELEKMKMCLLLLEYVVSPFHSRFGFSHVVKRREAVLTHQLLSCLVSAGIAWQMTIGESDAVCGDMSPLWGYVLVNMAEAGRILPSVLDVSASAVQYMSRLAWRQQRSGRARGHPTLTRSVSRAVNAVRTGDSAASFRRKYGSLFRPRGVLNSIFALVGFASTPFVQLSASKENQKWTPSEETSASRTVIELDEQAAKAIRDLNPTQSLQDIRSVPLSDVLRSIKFHFLSLLTSAPNEENDAEDTLVVQESLPELIANPNALTLALASILQLMSGKSFRVPLPRTRVVSAEVSEIHPPSASSLEKKWSETHLKKLVVNVGKALLQKPATEILDLAREFLSNDKVTGAVLRRSLQQLFDDPNAVELFGIVGDPFEKEATVNATRASAVSAFRHICSAVEILNMLECTGGALALVDGGAKENQQKRFRLLLEKAQSMLQDALVIVEKEKRPENAFPFLKALSMTDTLFDATLVEMKSKMQQAKAKDKTYESFVQYNQENLQNLRSLLTMMPNHVREVGDNLRGSTEPTSFVDARQSLTSMYQAIFATFKKMPDHMKGELIILSSSQSSSFFTSSMTYHAYFADPSKRHLVDLRRNAVSSAVSKRADEVDNSFSFASLTHDDNDFMAVPILLDRAQEQRVLLNERLLCFVRPNLSTDGTILHAIHSLLRFFDRAARLTAKSSLDTYNTSKKKVLTIVDEANSDNFGKKTARKHLAEVVEKVYDLYASVTADLDSEFSNLLKYGSSVHAFVDATTTTDLTLPDASLVYSEVFTLLAISAAQIVHLAPKESKASLDGHFEHVEAAFRMLLPREMHLYDLLRVYSQSDVQSANTLPSSLSKFACRYPNPSETRQTSLAAMMDSSIRDSDDSARPPSEVRSVSYANRAVRATSIPTDRVWCNLVVDAVGETYLTLGSLERHVSALVAAVAFRAAHSAAERDIDTRRKNMENTKPLLTAEQQLGAAVRLRGYIVDHVAGLVRAGKNAGSVDDRGTRMLEALVAASTAYSVAPSENAKNMVKALLISKEATLTMQESEMVNELLLDTFAPALQSMERPRMSAVARFEALVDGFSKRMARETEPAEVAAIKGLVVGRQTYEDPKMESFLVLNKPLSELIQKISNLKKRDVSMKLTEYTLRKLDSAAKKVSDFEASVEKLIGLEKPSKAVEQFQKRLVRTFQENVASHNVDATLQLEARVGFVQGMIDFLEGEAGEINKQPRMLRPANSDEVLQMIADAVTDLKKLFVYAKRLQEKDFLSNLLGLAAAPLIAQRPDETLGQEQNAIEGALYESLAVLSNSSESAFGSLFEPLNTTTPFSTASVLENATGEQSDPVLEIDVSSNKFLLAMVALSFGQNMRSQLSKWTYHTANMMQSLLVGSLASWPAWYVAQSRAKESVTEAGAYENAKMIYMVLMTSFVVNAASNSILLPGVGWLRDIVSNAIPLVDSDDRSIARATLNSMLYGVTFHQQLPSWPPSSSLDTAQSREGAIVAGEPPDAMKVSPLFDMKRLLSTEDEKLAKRGKVPLAVALQARHAIESLSTSVRSCFAELGPRRIDEYGRQSVDNTSYAATDELSDRVLFEADTSYASQSGAQLYGAVDPNRSSTEVRAFSGMQSTFWRGVSENNISPFQNGLFASFFANSTALASLDAPSRVSDEHRRFQAYVGQEDPNMAYLQTMRGENVPLSAESTSRGSASTPPIEDMARSQKRAHVAQVVGKALQSLGFCNDDSTVHDPLCPTIVQEMKSAQKELSLPDTLRAALCGALDSDVVRERGRTSARRSFKRWDSLAADLQKFRPGLSSSERSARTSLKLVTHHGSDADYGRPKRVDGKETSIDHACRTLILLDVANALLGLRHVDFVLESGAAGAVRTRSAVDGDASTRSTNKVAQRLAGLKRLVELYVESRQDARALAHAWKRKLLVRAATMMGRILVGGRKIDVALTDVGSSFQKNDGLRLLNGSSSCRSKQMVDEDTESSIWTKLQSSAGWKVIGYIDLQSEAVNDDCTAVLEAMVTNKNKTTVEDAFVRYETRLRASIAQEASTRWFRAYLHDVDVLLPRAVWTNSALSF